MYIQVNKTYLQHKPFAIIYGGILNFKSDSTTNSLNNLEIEDDESEAKKVVDSNFELVIFIKSGGVNYRKK